MRQVKINNLDELKARQAELRGEIKRIESEFSFRLYFLKKNTSTILLHQFFPSNKQMNERLGDLISLAFSFVISRLTGQHSEPESTMWERFFNWISEKFQKWFGKKKDDSIIEDKV